MTKKLFIFSDSAYSIDYYKLQINNARTFFIKRFSFLRLNLKTHGQDVIQMNENDLIKSMSLIILRKQLFVVVDTKGQVPF